MAKELHPKTLNEDQAVLVVGSLSNGFKFYGPFDNGNYAVRFADHAKFRDEWHVYSLTGVQVDEEGEWHCPLFA